MLLLHTSLHAQYPNVNGVFFIDGDQDLYNFLAADSDGFAELYWAANTETKTLYIAAFLIDGADENTHIDLNDNVVAPNPSGKDYVGSAGWNHHNFKHLTQSDHAKFRIKCGNNDWSWNQDYIYNDNIDDTDFTVGTWLSDIDGPDGCDGDCTLPDGLASSSSIVWNMNNTTWDVDQYPGNGNWKLQDWWSPNADGDDDVYDEGYPTYSYTHNWEWTVVYEYSIDYSACGDDPVEVALWELHSSPAKGSLNPPPPYISYLEVPINPLPLQWGDIRTNQVENMVRVYWETYEEFNNAKFDIMHSPDGVHYQKVGETDSDDSRTLGNRYEFYHSNPSPGINYYKIKQIDHDGQYSVSPISSVEVKLKGTPDLNIYPNPASNFIFINPSLDKPGQTTITLHDNLGREVNRIQLNHGTQQLRVDLSDLASGVYYIRDSGKDGALKLIKQ